MGDKTYLIKYHMMKTNELFDQILMMKTDVTYMMNQVKGDVGEDRQSCLVCLRLREWILMTKNCYQNQYFNIP